MIDYEKLNLLNNLAKTYAINNPQRTVAITHSYVNDTEEWSIEIVEQGKLIFDWPFDDANDLITKLQELTEAQPKYEVGQNVFWLDERAGGHIFHGVINAICRNQSDTMYGYDIDHLNYAEYKEMFPMAVSSSRWQLWDDDKLYPTKQNLIESQITYWQSLLEPEFRQIQEAPFLGKLSREEIKRAVESVSKPDKKECQHESDRQSFVKENGIPPGLTDCFKCKKCGEFYR